ncbi:CapA family protein [Clostridiaceae bacterium M8S5]|nr:CapA family protein [Clostridiaceae bacterium M8S5]
MSRYRRNNKRRYKGVSKGFYMIVFIALVGISIFAYNGLTSSAEKNNPAKTKEQLAQQNNDNNKPQENIIKEATILAAGDIMFHTTQLKAGYDAKTKTYNFDHFFKSITPYVKEADLAICNLETVTAGSKYRYIGYPTFNTPDQAIGSIKKAGFDILTTANNHCLDKKKYGLDRTIDVINKYNLKSTGTYKDEKHPLLIQEVKGIKMAIMSYTYGCNGLGKTMNPVELAKMVNIIDEQKIKSEIKKAEEAGVDLIIMCMHWGNEYNREPSKEQKELAGKMIEWGVDVILGSHPHVVQGSEIVKHNGEDKFIVYSMGNLISNQRRETMNGIMNKEYTEDGLMVKLNVQKDEKTNKTIIKKVEYIPTWVNRYKDNTGKLNYDVIPTIKYIEGNSSEFTKSVLSRIKQSHENTMKLMKQK